MMATRVSPSAAEEEGAEEDGVEEGEAARVTGAARLVVSIRGCFD